MIPFRLEIRSRTGGRLILERNGDHALGILHFYAPQVLLNLPFALSLTENEGRSSQHGARHLLAMSWTRIRPLSTRSAPYLIAPRPINLMRVLPINLAGSSACQSNTRRVGE